MKGDRDLLGSDFDRPGPRRSAIGALLTAVLLAFPGCSPPPGASRDERPGPRAPGLYAELKAAPGLTMGSPAASARPPLKTNAWPHAPFSVLQTCFCPAALYRVTSPELHLFAPTAGSGLGGPTYVAFSSRAGPRSFKAGTTLDAGTLEECWLLVWFAGASSWTNWDSPWAVFLQHKPRTLAFDTNGLHLKFSGAADDVVVMPLYGYFKPPQGTNDFLLRHGLPSKKVKPSKWIEILTRDVLTRVRYWANAMREFPDSCEESTQIDLARDTMNLQWQFAWHSIEDDWHTPHLKLAPIPPGLGLALREKRFPLTFSRPPMDYDLVTPFGPFYGIENVDAFTVSIPLLPVINEVQITTWPETNRMPAELETARAQMGSALEKILRDSTTLSPNTSEWSARIEEFATAINVAHALPLLSNEAQSNLIPSVTQPYWEKVFDERQLRRSEGTVESVARAKITEALWAAGQFGDATNLVRERWPAVRRLWESATLNWWGPERPTERSANAPPIEAAGRLAFARLAYQMGDLTNYERGCLLVVQELVRLHAFGRGIDYVRQHQPWNSMEFIPDDQFDSDLADENWEPGSPSISGSSKPLDVTGRWKYFQDPDIAAVCRSFFADKIQAEFRVLSRSESARTRTSSEASAARAFAFSLLLRESATNEVVSAPGSASAPAESQLAGALTALRPRLRTRYVRLISSQATFDLTTANSNDRLTDKTNLVNGSLTQCLKIRPEPDTKSPSAWQWPEPVWPQWKTPSGRNWSFGQVRPGGTLPPATLRLQHWPGGGQWLIFDAAEHTP